MENSILKLVMIAVMAYSPLVSAQAAQFTECLKGVNLENVKPEKMTPEQRKEYDRCRQVLAQAQPQ